MSLELPLNIKIDHYNTLPINIHKNTFANIMYLNARSLRNSLNDLQTFIDTQTYCIDIIAITETWLSENELSYFNLTHYTAFHSVRKNKRGGGVALYLRNSYDVGNLIFEQDFNNNNVVIISLLHHKFKISVWYRQPNNLEDADASRFITFYENTLSKHSNMFVLGDFNINLFLQTEMVFKYQNASSLNGYILLNNTSLDFPTRLNNLTGTHSCIDHILSDTYLHNPNFFFNLYLFDNIADHKNIILNIQSNEIKKLKCKSTLSLHLVNHKRIIEHQSIENLNPTDFHEYQSSISKIIKSNSYTIVKNAQQKSHINNEILSYIRIRTNYLKLKIQYPYWQYALNQYKYYRNLVKRLVKISKKKYLDNYFQENVSNPKKIWWQLKSTIYNSTPTYNTDVQLLLEDGISITNSVAIANRFNNYFASAPYSTINWSNFSNLNFNAFEDYDVPIHFPFICSSCTEDEISGIINNLNNSNAKDFYGLSNSFLKIHKSALLKNLTYLINQSLFNGVFPDALKLGIITPVYKTGSKTNKTNYRPITVSPVLGKVFEYAILRRLEDHLYTNSILSENQFGYTKRSNTEIAATHTLKHIYDSMDERQATALTCIDLSKAFDCISHDILMLKLRKLQLSDFFFNLIKSYLSDRLQAVRINDSLSDFILALIGTPQGGVLSGTLFNFYINSMNFLSLNSNLITYCDDMALITSASNPQLLKIKIEQDLFKIAQWLEVHKLSANATKTKYILFHSRKFHENFTDNPLNIVFNNVVLERVEYLKYLGLIIDERLNFLEHSKLIHKKITPFLYAFKRIRHLISKKAALDLYFAYINSHLLYMNVVWSAAPKYIINSLEILQRKALRIVYQKDSLCPRSELYSEKIMPVTQLNSLSCLLLVFKMNYNLAKNNFPIPSFDDIHNHRTRNRADFAIQICQTELGAANFYSRCLREFNELPTDIKRFRSIGVFKNKLREFLYNAICQEESGRSDRPSLDN